MEKKLTKSPRLNHLLYEMGIYSSYDVINHLPRRYDDLHDTAERNLTDKQRVVMIGKLVSLPRLVKLKGLSITTFEFISRQKNYFKVVAYNRPYLAKMTTLEDEFTLVGSYDAKKHEISMVNLYKGVIPEEGKLKAVYSLPQEFQNYLFANLVKRSLEELDGHIYSKVPFSLQRKYRLIDKQEALYKAHFPKNYDDVKQALRHLKYEEALYFSLKNQCIKETNKSLAKIKKEPIDLSICEPFLKTLPYSLTVDQKEACDEIIEDMNQSSLMYRLLQGDVGTGKTLVAFIALYANYVRGDQGALMAPTDALARQHYKNAQKLFQNHKLRIALLLGSTPISEKKQIYADLEDGSIDIIIGTHALFSKSVCYSSLGLAIIDEQHRFGVNQRIMLASKGEHADLLMMSATPIPRSLALTLYGDLDISTLTSYPGQKRNVVTEVVSSTDAKIFEYVDVSLKNNKRVYVVAPLIDFREDGRYSVEKLFSRYCLKYGAKVGLLHGKMKNEEKEKTLEDFYNGTISILVSTQVIEVGIDVQEADLMIIYDASSFGLASLHQLRGRIGRNGDLSHCLLAVDNQDDEEEIEKLDTLVHSNDGFDIAEADLKMRGPGELAGLKQAGIPNFAFLNVVSDYKIFVTAREDAKEIMSHQKEKEFSLLVNKAKDDIISDPLIKG